MANTTSSVTNIDLRDRSTILASSIFGRVVSASDSELAIIPGKQALYQFLVEEPCQRFYRINHASAGQLQVCDDSRTLLLIHSFGKERRESWFQVALLGLLPIISLFGAVPVQRHLDKDRGPPAAVPNGKTLSRMSSPIPLFINARHSK